MILDLLQKFVVRVDKTAAEKNENLRMLHYISGLSAEVGEVASIHQKEIRDYGTLDGVAISHVAEEIGDVLWYLAAICNFYNLRMSDLINLNIAKIERRIDDEFNNKEVENE